MAKRIAVALAVIALALFAYSVWPTAYRYHAVSETQIREARST